ncbi:MAG: alkaline phosphatase family protein [Elusimicrobia bacterium]|nr:alkaline phosphatase family protein [Elusimicrobiota bacterium]
MKKNITIRLSFAALLAFQGVLCAAAPRTDKPAGVGNVILVGWDGAQRAHLMELFSAGQLPNLKKLVSGGGLVFTEVTTGATQTKPGWAEILTGYSAVRLGILDNRNYRPIPKGYTVFERLKEFFGPGNIATIFLSGKVNNLGVRGPHEICINCVSRGSIKHDKTRWWDKKGITTSKTNDGEPPAWEHRDGEPYLNSKGSVDLYQAELGSAENVGKKALASLDKYHTKPFFAFFHFEEPDEQGHLYGENSKEYGEAIKKADHWLGELVKKLDSLGISDKTTIYVASDHGMDEGGFEHFQAPETFLATNGKRKLKNGDRKDITPTILEGYGMDLQGISPALDGKSLFDK